ncbi:MAG: hypothetical protein Q7N50_01085 [Armatimonadota bacterium]|nr:hypothetical protein [Armatimonadota bacterium]
MAPNNEQKHSHQTFSGLTGFSASAIQEVIAPKRDSQATPLQILVIRQIAGGGVIFQGAGNPHRSATLPHSQASGKAGGGGSSHSDPATT